MGDLRRWNGVSCHSVGKPFGVGPIRHTVAELEANVVAFVHSTFFGSHCFIIHVFLFAELFYCFQPFWCSVRLIGSCTGQIATELRKFQALLVLDLGRNKLSGEFRYKRRVDARSGTDLHVKWSIGDSSPGISHNDAIATAKLDGQAVLIIARLR